MWKLRSLVLALAVVATVAVATPASANTVPNWFWHWAPWYVHGKTGVRPAAAPDRIPHWGWRLLLLHRPHPGLAPRAVKPAPVAKKPAVPVRAPAGLTSADQSLLVAVNEARAANGLPALAVDPSLQTAAREHTDALLAAGAFTHDFVKNGSSYPFATWIRWYYPGPCAGENLAWGQPLDAPTAVRLWLASPGHRANMLSASFRTIGVALRTGANGRTIATTDFGGC